MQIENSLFPQITSSISELERRVITAVEVEMSKANNIDSLNKVYRQARVWNRFHHFLTNSCTYERYRELNECFKELRNQRRIEIKER